MTVLTHSAPPDRSTVHGPCPRHSMTKVGTLHSGPAAPNDCTHGLRVGSTFQEQKKGQRRWSEGCRFTVYVLKAPQTRDSGRPCSAAFWVGCPYSLPSAAPTTVAATGAPRNQCTPVPQMAVAVIGTSLSEGTPLAMPCD